jgi:hypothetical protein
MDVHFCKCESGISERNGKTEIAVFYIKQKIHVKSGIFLNTNAVLFSIFQKGGLNREWRQLE